MNHLLLVDDSAPLRAIVRRVVFETEVARSHAHGLTVVEADASAAALSALRRDPRIDVALVDVGLPGLGGVELVRALRRERTVDPLFVVAMTNAGDSEAARHARAAGADATIERPFSACDLERVLEPCGSVACAATAAPCTGEVA